MATKFESRLKSYRVLTNVVSLQQRNLLSQPLGNQAQALGLTIPGDDRKGAEAKIKAIFATIEDISKHGVIIDLCGLFEKSVLAAIGTALGEIRKITSSRYGLTILAKVKERVLKDHKSFESFDSQILLLDGIATVDTMSLLRRIQKHRNEVAHGVRPLTDTSLTVDDIERGLSEALNELGLR